MACSGTAPDAHPGSPHPQVDACNFWSALHLSVFAILSPIRSPCPPQVDAFYNFWYAFKSWREFPHPDEEDIEQVGRWFPAECYLITANRAPSAVLHCAAAAGCGSSCLCCAVRCCAVCLLMPDLRLACPTSGLQAESREHRRWIERYNKKLREQVGRGGAANGCAAGLGRWVSACPQRCGKEGGKALAAAHETGGTRVAATICLQPQPVEAGTRRSRAQPSHAPRAGCLPSAASAATTPSHYPFPPAGQEGGVPAHPRLCGLRVPPGPAVRGCFCFHPQLLGARGVTV